ncbi:MAG: flagellin [Opitutae bacterium]|nr:flagellin [Opitutae bacterium]
MNPITTSVPPARSLDQMQELLNRSLSRLSSGSRLVDPGEHAAGVAGASRLDGQSRRAQAAATNAQNAVSLVQTADSFLASFTTILSRLGELSALAGDAIKPPADIALYQREFTALQEQLRATIGGSTAEIGGVAGVGAPAGAFNGTALFGATPGLTIAIGAASDQDLTLPTTDLRGGAMLALISQDGSGNYTLAATDPAAPGAIAGATQQVAAQRAQLGASQSRLELVAGALRVELENLSAAISQIRDVDVAGESTRLARYNILLQAATAMQAQANQAPQAVLRLLRP